MKKLFIFVLGFLFLSCLAFGQLLINEVDADTPGNDAAEFIELYDGGAGNTALDGYVVVLFNGSSDTSYDAIDLDTYSTDANGYFVIGSTGMGTDIEISPGTFGWLQNGADAVALFTDDATNFPSGTAVTTTNLVDALVYDTNDSDDAGLLILLNGGEPQKNEDENGDKDTSSNQRIPNGSGGLRNSTTYDAVLATPGAQNPDPPTTATIIAAYTSNFDAIDVVYDLSMTAVNVGDYTLTGTTTITFTSAVIDGSDDTIVHLTGGSPTMVTDLTLDNIDDTVTNLDFYAGIMPISNTNTNNPTRATMLDGYYATFQGIVSANDAYNNVWISDAAGAYNGVLIYSSSFDGLVNEGDWIGFAAKRDIYNSLTELVSPILIYTISTGNDPYGPDLITGADIEETITVDTNPGESWEGQLVTIEDVYIESAGNYYYRCSDDAETTFFYVGDNVDYQLGSISLDVGETYESITGVVDWSSYGPYYRINPRDADDIVFGGNYAPEITNIVRDPAGDILPTSTVSVNANVTDDVTVSLVELHWGLTSGSLTNTITMSVLINDVYTTNPSVIPVHTVGTTVYYEVYAEDDLFEGSTSAEFDYTVVAENPPLVADFEADQTNVPPGSTVNFTDLTTGGVIEYSYEWDFSYDGMTFNVEETLANPAWEFPTIGVYDIALRVTDDELTVDEEIKIAYITVAEVAENIIINEVDSDQTSTDTAEFIELYDGGVGNTSLNGLVLVLYNGSDDQSYEPAYDLDGYSTDSNGYFVIGSSLVPNVDYDLGLVDNKIQNGADAVALYTGDAVDFPDDTPLTLVNLIDAIVYGTSDPDDLELLDLLNDLEPQVDEDGNGNKDTESMQRIPNGSGGARNTSTYAQSIPTPGEENQLVVELDAPTNVVITNDGTNVTVTWDAVVGATGYTVYISADPYAADPWSIGVGIFDLLTDPAHPTWTETTTTGVKYFYKVTATN